MSSKRNKKYNPELRKRRNTVSIVKNFLVSFFVNAEHVENSATIRDFKGNLIPATPLRADLLENSRFKWTVMLGIFYKEKGNMHCPLWFATATKECQQRDLVVALNKVHQKFIKEKQNMGVKVIGAGWIASPVGLDLDEEMCGNIFEKIGALDNVSATPKIEKQMNEIVTLLLAWKMAKLYGEDESRAIYICANKIWKSVENYDVRSIIIQLGTKNVSDSDRVSILQTLEQTLIRDNFL